ncbi:MAG: hypothetical protein QXE34_00865 [Candidatus Aenigmatarchaeota archaeon]
MKKILIIIFMLFLIKDVFAVTVSCGRPYMPNNIFTGDYIFTNTENFTVKVFIDKKFSLINIYPTNLFYLEPNESKVISFRSYAGMVDTLFVFVTDTRNGFSSSLECRYYALPEGSFIPVITTTTTTTTIPQVVYDCNGRSFYNCATLPGCKWVGNMFTGYCVSIYGATTTVPENSSITTTTTINNQTTTPTTPQNTNTTTTTTTTTPTNICQSLNFWQCQSNSNCRWTGDIRFGKCISTSTTTVTTQTPTPTTTETTTTTTTPTTTICSTVCNRWLRLVCLEWKTICVF